VNGKRGIGEQYKNKLRALCLALSLVVMATGRQHLVGETRGYIKMTQGTIVRREKRVRGPFGQIVKWVFILFNLFMIFCLFKGIGAVGTAVHDASSEAERAGASIGTAIGMTMILAIWGFGDVILGLFVLLTRGDKIVIEEMP
jgi:ABC-type Fe3+ transport system permease subunit